MNTPEEIAAYVLTGHAIQPHWNRTGEQVRALLVEAVTEAQAQSLTQSEAREVLAALQLTADVFKGFTPASITRAVELMERAAGEYA